MEAVSAVLVNGARRVFPDFDGKGDSLAGAGVLYGDTYSFQVAHKLSGGHNDWIRVGVESLLSDCITLRAVKLMPSAYPDPGMYPDRLEKAGDNRYRTVNGQWRSLWVDIEPDETIAPGMYMVALKACGDKGEELFTLTMSVEVLGARLPELPVYHTEWLHTDCLANYYHVAVWSEEHFGICESFIENAVRNNVNTILTPLFTPPIDTAEGGFRTPSQLVSVSVSEGAYCFGFALLRQWIHLCERCGVRYFEMSHLFSQWGAKYAPAVYSDKNELLFGWHTAGDGAAYTGFLEQFLPALRSELKQLGIWERCLFHISDEPERKDLKRYARAKALTERLLPGCTVIDALSDLEFFKSGAADTPVVAMDSLADFLNAGVKGLWAYYCGIHRDQVTNRLFSMPLARCRVLGLQLYKYDIKGFLHWGFNFYSSQFSVLHLNPYEETDAGEIFPSGDPFLVYPGADKKPEETLRLMALRQAFNDYRALVLLERPKGRAYAVSLLAEVTLTEYPTDAGWYVSLRDRINKEAVV